ncbi:MAG: hypothetical protein EPN56_05295 [Rhodanobacter sp.]|nr:MAG: hypothetical protein EPN78_01520 [Rhodanobacter sp.]TAM15137.1 MAG: hypothetical protein EPN66_00890 [Rhodanobacter sp.]TAM36393.1 MAG: hypothetical protein EPN56_05295 [Rhodanobacter sp.]
MTDTAAALRKGRVKLLLVGAVFLVPFLVALALTLAGWQPTAKGNGLPILPQRNFAQEQLSIRMADGGVWAWRDVKPRLTLIALPGPDCASHCYAALTALAKARVMLNQNQSRLRLLYVGAPPTGADAKGMANFWRIGADTDGKLDAWRPSEPDSLGAVLVESDGTALASYPAGFDPAGVLRDLRKVIR